jgi:ribosomal protein S8
MLQSMNERTKTMRLSKAQLKIVAVLQNQGWIWQAAGMPYLAVNEDGRVKSTPMHNKVFTTLKEHKIIKQVDNKWVLA